MQHAELLAGILLRASELTHLRVDLVLRLRLLARASGRLLEELLALVRLRLGAERAEAAARLDQRIDVGLVGRLVALRRLELAGDVAGRRRLRLA